MVESETGIGVQSYLASLPAAWKRRFPHHEYLLPITPSRAAFIFSRLVSKIVWAWTGLGYHIIWIGNRLEAEIVPYGADPETFRRVSFDDFLSWYGYTLVEESNG